MICLKPIEIEDDISVGSFFRQRLGNEVLENLIEPLMGGIYGTDIDQLSLMSTFPNFKEKEEQFGSLIKGMKDEKEQRIKKRQLYPGAPKGQFKQFRHGLSSFIEALVKDIESKGVHIRYNTPVKDILISQKDYEILLEDDSKEKFNGLLVTTPHQVFLNWFSHDPAFDYFKTWILLLSQQLFWPLMRKILPIRTMELALLLQEQVKRILLHVLGHQRNGHLLLQKVKF